MRRALRVGVLVSRDVVRFHVGVFGSATVTRLTGNVDVLLIAHFVGATETGLYRAARQLADTARIPFTAISRSLQAEYSKLWFGFDGTALRRTVRRYAVLMASGALLMFATLAILSDVLVAMVYGAAFAATVPLFIVMIPGSLTVSCLMGVSTLPQRLAAFVRCSTPTSQRSRRPRQPCWCWYPSTVRSAGRGRSSSSP